MCIFRRYNHHVVALIILLFFMSIVITVSGELLNENQIAHSDVNLHLTEVSAVGTHSFTCRYKETQRHFSEYAPDNEANVKGIILMLHGYGSSGEDFRLLTKMDVQANKRGYSVVYPTGMNTPEDPTSATGWNSGIGISSSDDIGFLRALAAYMQIKYNLTRAETYAAGFSNGGFMIYRLAVEAENEFAGVAGVAAMMPAIIWENRKPAVDISVLQINGTKDDAVPMRLNGSNKYTKAPAIEDVIAYFANANDLKDEVTESISSRVIVTKYYSDTKSEMVWMTLIKDGRHSWPEQKYCGMDANSLVLDFFGQVHEMHAHKVKTN